MHSVFLLHRFPVAITTAFVLVDQMTQFCGNFVNDALILRQRFRLETGVNYEKLDRETKGRKLQASRD